MQTSFDVPLQMILTGIAALVHSHCRYKTGLPITSSYYQKPLICHPFLSYFYCKQVVATHTCFHLHPALLQQRIIRLAPPNPAAPHKACGFSSIPLIMMGIRSIILVVCCLLGLCWFDASPFGNFLASWQH
jgi:hypothetical protein